MELGSSDVSESQLTTRTVVLTLLLNVMVSLFVLPVMIPPFKVYTIRELVEVSFWQITGLIGWPLGIIGYLSNMISTGDANLAKGLLLFIYPLMLTLLGYTLFFQRHRRWTLAMLNLLVTLSFALVWYKVLNGYEFMIG